MKLTRGGISYNLPDSPYNTVIHYEDTYIEYFFSSQRYLDKFLGEYENNRTNLSDSLTNRFGIRIENDVLSDVVLYRKIEKRGFFIRTEYEDIVWQKDIILDGKNLMSKN